MRITSSMMARLGVDQIGASRARLAATQEKAATGLRINRPSDDPNGYQVASQIKGSVSETDRFLRGIDASRTRLDATESSLNDAVELLAEARVRAIQARNGTNGAVAQPAILIAVEDIFNRLVEEGNAQSVEGSYLYSGFTSSTPAFSQAGTFTSGSPPPTVTFTGDGNQVSLEVDENVYVDITLDGSRVFQGNVDVFQAVSTLWTGIDTGNNVLIDQAIGELDLAHEQVIGELARIGSSSSTANRFEERLQIRQEELAARLSSAEDADVFKVYSDLTTQETALQASLQVTSSMLGPSLLDFL